jgi:toxin ParE1/3/4
MKWRLALGPQADRDINNHFEHIAKDSLEAAVRFYEAAFRALDVLRRHPHIGPTRQFQHPQLNDIRIWLVKDFRNILSSTAPLNERVEILRVLHASRDIDNIFSDKGNETS